jgi:pyridoxal phosphate enzyme (YggS family)
MMAEIAEIAENLTRIRERIAAAAARSGRRPEEILLVAVSKEVEPERIQQAVEAGVSDIGENYLQEALLKQPKISHRVRWHFIGHLQRNKARQVLEAFDVIQSVDSLRLAEEINRRAESLGKEAEVLVQINTSGEESKFGVRPEDCEALIEGMSALRCVRMRGLMTIGRFEPDPEASRGEFRLLRRLFERVRGMNLPGVEMRWLSMGMTHDFEVAIEEGGNLVRIGRGIFGPRRR